MAEGVTLAQPKPPITRFKMRRLVFQLGDVEETLDPTDPASMNAVYSHIEAHYESEQGEETRVASVHGPTARAILIALNEVDLSTKPLMRRVNEYVLNNNLIPDFENGSLFTE